MHGISKFVVAKSNTNYFVLNQIYNFKCIFLIWMNNIEIPTKSSQLNWLKYIILVKRHFKVNLNYNFYILLLMVMFSY